MASESSTGFAANSPGLFQSPVSGAVMLLNFTEVASGQSYCITEFSREKMAGWIDVADRVVGW